MQVNRDNIRFFNALASETRLSIIELLSERTLNIRQLADALGISSTIVTRHVSELERVGIVRCESKAGTRGMQRLCSLAMYGKVLNFRPEKPLGSALTVRLPVGQYSACQATPTCGLVTRQAIIGEVDDPRYFADPSHVEADMVWLSSGFVEYTVPNYMTVRQRVTSLLVQMEICSEAPGCNPEWPSDIEFSINGRTLGIWTSPGDFGERPGLLTPDWWPVTSTQFGMLKMLTVNREGSFMDGVRIGEVCVDQLGLCYAQPILLRIASRPEAANPGGFTLFGKGFGNYNQDIVVSLTLEGVEG